MYIEHFNALQKLIENQLINGQTLPIEWFNEQYENLKEQQGHRFPRGYFRTLDSSICSFLRSEYILRMRLLRFVSRSLLSLLFALIFY